MIIEPGDLAIDYSFARPDPAAIVAAGVRLVVRYISPNRGNGKNITMAERDALLAAGLSLLLVWENLATDPLQGAPLGTQHGVKAAGFARDLGYPSDMPIIAAVDTNPVQLVAGKFVDKIPVILEYLAAFHDASGWRQGTYGNDQVITAAHDAGVSELGWQTRAWSQGRRSPHADCLQEIGFVHPSVAALGSVDDNTVLRPFAAWSNDVTPPPTQPIGVDMKSGHYRDDRPDGEWQVWWLNRDWKDSLYTYPVNDMPRGGDYDLLDQLPDDLLTAKFSVLDAIMRRQNRPTPLPGASDDVHPHAHDLIAIVKTGGVSPSP